MRIVGGRFRGRPLRAPSSAAIRPTTDSLRERLFNILTHWQGTDVVEGARVIDLFAGTGALGLEALSRGASFALFVDDGAEARALLRDNVESLGVAGTSRIFRRDATKLGEAPSAPFTLAFLDPPYGQGLASAALGRLMEGRWLASGAIVAVEEAGHAEVTLPAGMSSVDLRHQGDTAVRLCVVDSPA